MNKFWSEEREALLRKMVKDGRSCGEIADELGTTSNAVIGKCHRMGLKIQGVKTRPQMHSRRKPPAPRLSEASSPKITPSTHETVSLMRRTIEVPESRPGAVSLFDLESDQCRWPTVGGPPMLFCGSPTIEGCSYCPDHARVAYPRQPLRRSTNFTWGRR